MLSKSEPERGRLAGLSNGRILAYLKSLGITSLELMPVFAMLALMINAGITHGVASALGGSGAYSV